MSTISCLCVTQEGRLNWLAQSVADFAAQTHAARELVLLHDGGEAFHAALQALARQHGSTRIAVHRELPGATLGQLRNRSVDLATGDLLCQWDDDDRYHPLRLAHQLARLEGEAADACFLVDQLQLFEATRQLFWTDWNIERYPYNLIPGTLLARRPIMPRYPDSRRGEDSGLVDALLRQGARLARLHGEGWLYIYRHTGANTFESSHHEAIARHKRRRGAHLLCAQALLTQRLGEYQPPLPPLSLPWDDGALQLP